MSVPDLLHTKINSPFEHDIWDVYDYLSVLAFSEELREDVDRYQREAYDGRSFVADAVFALNGCQPKADDPVGKAWSEIMASTQFGKLQKMCKDRLTQASVVMQLASMVERAVQEKGSTRKCPECGSDRVATFEGSGPESESGWAGQCQECGVAIAELEEDESETGVAVVLPSNLDEHLEEIKAEAVLVGTLGAYMTGSPSERFEKALELTDQFDVKEFVGFLGWAKHVIGGERRRTRGGSEEMTGYGSGPWSDRVVPHQMLAVAEGELGALASLADNSLTRRRFDADRPSGRGPVVLMRDESGSMGPEYDPPYARHKTALSFELSLAEAFNREGRDLISLAWSSRGTRLHVYGEEGLREHLTSFLNGGTDIRGPMEEAVDTAGRYALDADILIVTDGHLFMSSSSCRTLLDIVEPFRGKGGRVWAVSLGVGDERLAWTDGYVCLDELEPGARLGDILRGMTRDEQSARKRRL